MITKLENQYSRIVVERRILFDGAAIETLAEESQPSDLVENPKNIEVSIQNDKFEGLVSAVEDGKNSIYVIDEGLDDVASIVELVPSDAHIIMLSVDYDITRLASEVTEFNNIDALHIITHANQNGAFQIGQTMVDANNINQIYQDEWLKIGNALAENADVLIYGCDLAASTAGEQTLVELAEVLGSDIAASEDITGISGDWDLEFQIGAIEEQSFAAPDWQGNLDLVPVISIPSIALFSEDQPLIFADAGVAQISVGDLNGSVAEVQLAVAVGSLSLTQSADVTLTEGTGTNDSTVTLQGSVASVNAALNSLVYTPDEDYNGLVNITVNLTDSFPLVPITVTAVLPLSISAVSDIVADAYDVPVNASVTLDLMGNDTFENLGASITSFTSPANGTISQDISGNYIYTPNTNFQGQDSFEYTVTSNGTVETATVTMNVNTAPVANDTTGSGNEDSTITLNVLADASDVDGDSLTVSAPVVESGQGTVTVSNNQIVFTPATDFNGEAVISYTVADGNGGTDTGEVTVTVNPQNDAPVANGTTGSGNEDSTITLNVLADASDVDGDSLTVSAPVVESGQGTVTVSNNQIVFTPATDFNGEAVISYTVADGNGGTDTGEVTVTVNPQNDAPVAGDVTAETRPSETVTIDVIAQARDADGDEMTIELPVLETGRGSLSIENNNIVFTPAEDYLGEASISYQLVDENGARDSGSVTVTVSENVAPIATDMSIHTEEDTSVKVNLLDLVSDHEGDNLSFPEARVVTGEGQVSIENGELTFTPGENFNGVAEISYTVADEYSGTDSANITVTVSAVNDQPVVNNTTGQETTAGNQVTLDVLAAAEDADGDVLTVSNPVLLSGEGAVSVSDNKVVYTPSESYSGQAVIQYTVTDSSGASVTATVTITVNAIERVEMGDDIGNITLINEALNRGENFSYQAIDYDPVLLDAINGISLLPSQVDVSQNQPNLSVVNNFSVVESFNQISTLASSTNNLTGFDSSNIAFEPAESSLEPNLDQPLNGGETEPSSETLEIQELEADELDEALELDGITEGAAVSTDIANNTYLSDELDRLTHEQVEQMKGLLTMLS
ncbi:tandem-95 repeat protein [Marinomonas sp.]